MLTRREVFERMTAAGYCLTMMLPSFKGMKPCMPAIQYDNRRMVYTFGIIHNPGEKAYLATFGPKVQFKDDKVVGYDHSQYECYTS